MKTYITTLFLFFIVTSCSKSVKYSPDHIKQTSGRYSYNQNEVIDVYYDNNVLFLKWKGASKIKPVSLDENTFFVADMYQKLRFVQHPETKKWYLGIVSETDETKVIYEYPKVDDTYKTPRMYFTDGEYDKATAGYLELQKQDSTKIYIEENEINRLGYRFVREKKYKNAIAVLKMNVALYPESDNVYDSLGEAFLRQGDSLQAFNNYQKAFELNTGNKRAKEFLERYKK